MRYSSVLWRALAAGSGGGQARGFLRVWRWWERFASWRWPAARLSGAEDGLFHVRLVHYRGKPVSLGDMTVQPGDLVGELHLENERLAAVVTQSEWRVLPPLKKDLAAIARSLQSGELPADMRAIYGVTVLGRGAAWLGFTVQIRPPGWKERLERLYFDGLLLIYSPNGWKRLNRGVTGSAYPTECWMSRAELLRHYGS